MEYVSSIPAQMDWDSDSHLVFTPEKIGRRISTTPFNLIKLFRPNTKMESWQYSFDTLPLTATINEFRFYQDPLHPAEHYAVATMNFLSRLMKKVSGTSLICAGKQVLHSFQP